MSRALVIVLVGVFGCNEHSVDARLDGEPDSETAGSTSSTSAGETGAPSPDDEDPPASICDPPPGDVFLHVVFDADSLSWHELEHDEPCVVVSANVEDRPWQIELECAHPDDTHRHVIAIDVGGTSAWTFDESAVRLRVIATKNIDTTSPVQLVIANEAGDPLLAVFYVVRWPVPVVPAEFFAPLSIEVIDDVCSEEPFEPIEEGTFIMSPCQYAERRLALAIGSGEDRAIVHDRQRATVGEHEFVVLARDDRAVPEYCDGAGHTSRVVAFLALRKPPAAE